VKTGTTVDCVAERKDGRESRMRQAVLTINKYFETKSIHLLNIDAEYKGAAKDVPPIGAIRVCVYSG
jgi:hypothetical protein